MAGQDRPKKNADGPSARPPQKKRERGFVGYLKERHDPLTSLLLTIPIFLIYHLGILVMDLRNGVDLFTQLTFDLLEHSKLAYVLVTLAYALAIGGAAFVLRRRGTIRAAEFGPVLGESVILAVVMIFAVGWATDHLFHWQIGPVAMGPIDKIVMAAGAGFHEELVFRVLLFGGMAFVLKRIPMFPAVAGILIAAVVSSIVFSAIHYFGPLSDPFTFVSFVFRIIAGLYLCAVYHYRGFAVAVYTHMIYDVIVFFMH